MADELNQEEWLRQKIYRPLERVRARQLPNEDWEVFDGIEVHTFTDEQFRGAYTITAQSQHYNKERGQYEYH